MLGVVSQAWGLATRKAIYRDQSTAKAHSGSVETCRQDDVSSHDVAKPVLESMSKQNAEWLRALDLWWPKWKSWSSSGICLNVLVSVSCFIVWQPSWFWSWFWLCIWSLGFEFTPNWKTVGFQSKISILWQTLIEASNLAHGICQIWPHKGNWIESYQSSIVLSNICI